MTKDDLKSLSRRVRALWEQKLDTKDISHALQIPEHECESALHRSLEIKRSVKTSLKDSQ